MVGVNGTKLGANDIMRIALCDDEKIFRQELKKILIEYRNRNRFEIEIYEFENGEKFLESKLIFDIVFMDYQMKELDGMETARKLREKNNLCCIVFVTNYPQFILDSFAVQPFRFLVKPIDKLKIYEMMQAYIKLQKQFFPINIIENGEIKTIGSKDIMYLQGDRKYCWIYTAKSIYHSSKTLAKNYQLLPPHGFCRVHRSYVVNMFCIDSIKENTIILINGERIPISRIHLSEFKRAYLAFIKNHFVRI